jgi:large subunit ribosomal protein L35
MPKLKTHSGAKDRASVTKNGKVRTGHPNRNHFMEKKSGSRRRSLSGLGTLSGKTAKNVKQQLGV